MSLQPLPKTLYVGGLSDEVTDQILRQAFEPFGPIREAKVKREAQDNAGNVKSKGFGFVEFEDGDDADAAEDNMHESELFGRTLTVNKSKGVVTSGSGGGGVKGGSFNPSKIFKPVWADDFFYKQGLENAGLEMNKSMQ